MSMRVVIELDSPGEGRRICAPENSFDKAFAVQWSEIGGSGRAGDASRSTGRNI